MALRLSGLPGSARTGRTGWPGSSRPSERPSSRSRREPADATTARTACHAVAVIGAGYVGLPTAATLAHFGHPVVLAEREPSQAGGAALGADAHRGGRARRAGGRGRGRRAALASPTRRSRRSRAPSSSSSACPPRRAPTDRPTSPTSRRRPRRSGRTWSPVPIVVNKSTVPVGSATMVEQVIGRPDVSVVSNPEFLREGTAVLDSLNPDRIVVGADDPQAAAKVGELFSTHPGAADRHRRDDVGDDQVRLQRLPGHQAELRQRAGRPVRGGGRRRPRRPARARLRQAHRLRVPASRARVGRLLPAQGHPGAAAHRRRGGLRLLAAGGRHRLQRRAARRGWWPRSRRPAAASVDGATVAVWGLTFKANTDDRRDSPSLRGLRTAWSTLGATVQAFDPTVDRRTPTCPTTCTGLQLRADPYEAACRGAAPWWC